MERRRLGELLTRNNYASWTARRKQWLGGMVRVRYIWRSKETAMVITVELDRDTDQRLAALAARTGKSKAEHAAEILKYGIEDVEDHYRADDVWQRVQRGEERVVSSEELRRELGLED